jgi:glyoxylase-like metal-dependent hydrolase (beta-lactamase superfamily II)
MQAIASGIYYESNYPGVTLGAVIMPRGTLMIDAPLRPEDARTWKSVLLTQSRGTHRLLVNLDGHPDRTLGARYVDCTVVAQQNVLDTFNNRTSVFKGQPSGSGAEWEHYPEISGTRWILPNLTFSDRMVLHWDTVHSEKDTEIIIEYHPGPSDGAAWVIVPNQKVVFIGDAILLDQPPFLEMSHLPSWINTLSVLRSPRYRNYTIISGRGGPVNIEYVRDQHELLKSLHKRLETHVEKGTLYENTDKIIQTYLQKFNYPPALHNIYAQRLRYGLECYIQRHYPPEVNTPGA